MGKDVDSAVSSGDRSRQSVPRCPVSSSPRSQHHAANRGSRCPELMDQPTARGGGDEVSGCFPLPLVTPDQGLPATSLISANALAGTPGSASETPVQAKSGGPFKVRLGAQEPGSEVLILGEARHVTFRAGLGDTGHPLGQR